MTKIYKILSYIFHPVFIPIVGVFIILNITHLALLPDISKKALLYLVSFSTILFPLIILPLLYYQKIITGVTMSNRKERLIPLFLTSVFYYMSYYILHKYSAPLFIQKYMMTIFICILLTSIINIKWKISLHMIGIGGLIGLMSALFYLYKIDNEIIFYLLILISGIIGTARLYLREHNSTQIYAGFIVGFISNFIIIIFLNLSI